MWRSSLAIPSSDLFAERLVLMRFDSWNPLPYRTLAF